jgi:hypothetical protein
MSGREKIAVIAASEAMREYKLKEGDRRQRDRQNPLPGHCRNESV